MNTSTSDEVEKPWDHPWTTREMRENRNEWSLAGDVGLLKHLQQFSQTLTAKVKDTQKNLDLLSSQLNETTVLIDNVTNASLALANTQFIESRVYEDDQEHEQQKKSNNREESKELSEAEMIALVSENIHKGIQFMDEKYERREVLASDSEDETEISAPSFILRPKDPYKDRPLPYIIGTDKWKASNKIGIESSSSSESEAVEDEDDSESDEDNKVVDSIFNSSNRNPVFRPRSSSPSCSSESSDFNKSNTTKQFSGPSSNADRLYTRSQDTLSSTSEITTPINEVPKLGHTDKITPNFVKELNKKLGNIVPSAESTSNTFKENHSPSINRSEDDLFNSEDNNDENILSVKSDNVFNSNLFNEEVSNSLWDNKIFKRPQTNIIPASMDVPPPIHPVETKPKSAMADLFGDIDSEDSDDMFSPKISTKTSTDKTSDTILPKNKLDPRINAGEMSTSTPGFDNIPNFFGDNDNLFSPVTNASSNKSAEVSKIERQENLQGLPTIQSDLLSSSLGSRLFQRTNQESSESSESEDGAEFQDDKTTSASVQNNTEISYNVSNAPSNPSIIIAHMVHGDSNNSSGIFLQPPSLGSIRSAEFGSPELTSTRRMSAEEFSRARVISDSLLNAARQEVTNSGSDISSPALHDRTFLQESSNTQEDDLFNDDVFSPPPLSKIDSKSKSKVNSLFDDSDSGDDLFSNTSSGSRSQKSADLLANSSQYVDKSKSNQKKGIFDEEIDIFANQGVSDIDIFAPGPSEPRISQLPFDTSSNKVSNSRFIKETVAAAKPLSTVTKLTDKIPNIFDDSDDEDDLFSPKVTKQSAMLSGNDNLLTNSSDSAHKDELAKPKKDSTVETAAEKGEKNSKVKLEEKRDSEQALASAKVARDISSESKLFHDSESDDDSLFSKKKPMSLEINETESITQERLADKNTMISSALVQEKSIIENTSTVDGGKISKMDHSKQEILIQDNSIKKPPTSLKIRLPTITSDDDSNSAPRRVVSGKIKDLMGKMGDLKILSPTDTPLTFRKIGEKLSDSDLTPDRDSEDGSSFSISSAKSPPLTPNESISKREAPLSPSIEIESAVSFDVPAQAESQTIKGSKILQNRARIPMKRRPQSRHARQSALRTSGIDFDDVDKSESTVDSSILDLKHERLSAPNADDQEESLMKRKSGLHLATEDKSEISVGKEGSISTTKNTLMSPSTDEEDLFDVPPDLPEDPPKEDGLFGRAPILSPIQRRQSPENVSNYGKKESSVLQSKKEENKLSEEKKPVKNEENSKEPVDPLRDGNHDPLKDPSQLFAFVTKTPSPEKGQNLLFDEDDSLFTKNMKKSSFSTESTKRSLDLFDDDSNSDLFSGPFTKPVKKSSKDSGKNNLFNDIESDDETDDLFGSVHNKKSNQSKPEQSDNINEMNASGVSFKTSDDFDNDDDEEDLFFDASEKPSFESTKNDQLFASKTKIPKTKLEDIFGDHSSGEDDFFTIKKPLSKNSSSGLFFKDAEDDDGKDLFTKKLSSTSTLGETENRMPVKKSITKDLRKTAEKIVEDPLSMLDDD
ncbi:WASH complex subunit 2 [Chelonus insularis]|uniref:WASH complex subunit 2 n=1 Tax=Chelonus insularis TaxID=460826 RepID=UPI00158F0935|nr:WASH complex subunit 2 [Chelonus insularis]